MLKSTITTLLSILLILVSLLIILTATIQSNLFMFNISDQTQHTDWVDANYNEHEGQVINVAGQSSWTEYLETKGKDGWVYRFGTSRGNSIALNSNANYRAYGYTGNDTFVMFSSTSNQNNEIKDFNDQDKIKLDPYYAGTTYNIQNENNIPVLYQNYGSTTGNVRVLRVEGERASGLTNEELQKAKTGTSDYLVYK